MTELEESACFFNTHKCTRASSGVIHQPVAFLNLTDRDHRSPTLYRLLSFFDECICDWMGQPTL